MNQGTRAPSRDYQLSLVILAAGAVLFGSALAYALVGAWVGSYPTSGTGSIDLATGVIGTAGFAMMFAGSIYVSRNRPRLPPGDDAPAASPPS